MTDDVAQLLQSLRLKKMAELVDAALQRAEQQQRSDQDFLARLLRAQWQANQEHALAWRIQRAGLPEQWTLESFPFTRQPGVSPKQIRTFAELEFIPRAEHIVCVGPTGVGKTRARLRAAAQGAPERAPRHLHARPGSLRREVRLARGMVSASIYRALAELARCEPPESGALGMLLAFGTGVACEMTLVRWRSAPDVFCS
jgi:IstB-like ATP binding protein